MYRSETITLGIGVPAREVYDFLREPRNLPSWSADLGPTFEHLRGNDWVTELPEDGRIIYRYSDRNPYLILDHAEFPEGTVPFVQPFRIVENEGGAELLFTLFQRPGMTEAELASEAEWVLADLNTLKTFLETRRR